MSDSTRTKIHKLILCAIFIVQLIISINVISKKESYHADEVFSYKLANMDFYDMFDWSDGIVYDHGNEVWNGLTTVNENHRFDIRMVWRNQAYDVHPPLYYLLLHIISACFPNVMSRWFAGIINLVFGTLICWLVYDIAKKLMGDYIGVITLLCYIFTAGTIHSLSFLRMYVMITFLMLLAYKIIVLDGDVWDRKRYIKLYVTVAAGMLTHYYFIPYVLMVCLVYAASLMKDGDTKVVFNGVKAVVLAMITGIIIFPQMIAHIFLGYRGQASIENLVGRGTKNLLLKVGDYVTFLSDQVYGGFLFVVIIVAVAAVVINAEYFFCQIRACLYLPAIVYFFLISISSPLQVDRYMFPIYPIAVLFLLDAINGIMQKIGGKKKLILLAMIGLAYISMMAASYQKCNWQYLYRGTGESIERVASMKDNVDTIVYFTGLYDSNLNFIYSFSPYFERNVFVKKTDTLIDQIEAAKKDCLLYSLDLDSPELLESLDSIGDIKYEKSFTAYGVIVYYISKNA